MPDMHEICADLAAEHAALDAVVANLDDADWDRATPAEGWTVRDQIGHLAFFDERAAVAAAEPDRFTAELEDVLAGRVDVMAEHVRRGRQGSGQDVLGWWRDARTASLAAFAALDPKARVPWYGPAMSAVSFATARLMETWAHGQDVVDALGSSRPATDRLRHVAHIGVRALPFSFQAHGRPVPQVPVRVELLAPSGLTWMWGAEGAADAVRGPALDFCLVVTQRRHPADTELQVVGAVATEWIGIAQAFAGPPGAGRRPGQFRTPVA